MSIETKAVGGAEKAKGAKANQQEGEGGVEGEGEGEGKEIIGTRLRRRSKGSHLSFLRTMTRTKYACARCVPTCCVCKPTNDTNPFSEQDMAQELQYFKTGNEREWDIEEAQDSYASDALNLVSELQLLAHR